MNHIEWSRVSTQIRNFFDDLKPSKVLCQLAKKEKSNENSQMMSRNQSDNPWNQLSQKIITMLIQTGKKNAKNNEIREAPYLFLMQGTKIAIEKPKKGR